MPKSPFTPNAVLVFQVASSTLEKDRSGNLAPKLEPLEVKAYLKKAGRNVAEAIVQPGADEIEEIVDGYAVEPMTLPDAVGHLAKAKMEIYGVRGTFILHRSIPSEAEAVTGTKLVGEFRRGI